VDFLGVRKGKKRPRVSGRLICVKFNILNFTQIRRHIQIAVEIGLYVRDEHVIGLHN